MKTYPERFWERVDKSGECFLWTGSGAGNGYGQCTIGHKKQGYAHRFAYELTYGPIPAGMEIDHLCHNRRCANPEHLRVVTRKQNCEHHAGAYANSSSGVRGVSWKKSRNKWVAQVRHNNETIYLGLFETLSATSNAVMP